MDDLIILAAKAARLRSSMKQADDLNDSGLTSFGKGTTALGLAGAATGYGGQHAANKYLGPVGQVQSDLSGGLAQLGQALGMSKKPTVQIPRNANQLAGLFRNRGSQIGKAGLGTAGVGAALWLMGRNNDTAVARGAARDARGQLGDLQSRFDSLQGENSGLNDQLGQLRSQLTGNEGTISSLRSLPAACLKN